MHGKSSASSPCVVVKQRGVDGTETTVNVYEGHVFIGNDGNAHIDTAAEPTAAQPFHKVAGTRHLLKRLIILKFLDLILPADGDGGSFEMRDKEILGRVYDLLPPECHDVFSDKIRGDKVRCYKSLRESLRTYRQKHKI